MAKLRVGEILIEDNRVSIGGKTMNAGADASTASIPQTPSQSTTPFLLWLRDSPIPSRALGWFGAAMIGLGLLLAFAAKPWNNPFGAVWPGGLLLAFGTGLAGTALLKQRLHPGDIDLNRLALGAQSEELVGRVRSLLARDGKHQTVEWLQRQTALEEAFVVRALAILRDQGEVDEELNPESGDFYYHHVSRAPQDLESRLASINQRRNL